MKLDIRPLTPDLWPSLEDLFGGSGPCSRCWCMYWRIGPAYRRRPAEQNKAAFRAVVEEGPPPGLLAFRGDLAVGWCQVTPRDAVPWLNRARGFQRLDDVPVWSLTCLYVRKGHRRQGVTSALIEGAIAAARHAKIPALEAYPLDAAKSPSATGTGYASTLSRAGFRVLARPTPPRPIMRYDLAKSAP